MQTEGTEELYKTSKEVVCHNILQQTSSYQNENKISLSFHQHNVIKLGPSFFQILCTF